MLCRLSSYGAYYIIAEPEQTGKAPISMVEILEYIERRRSIRRFTEEPVSREDLELLLRAGMAAPSATNRRPWQFVVVTDPDRLDALRKRLPLGRYNAPAALVVCGDLRRALPPSAQSFWVVDCSAATENTLLAAAGIGLGAVWIGVYPLRPLMAPRLQSDRLAQARATAFGGAWPSCGAQAGSQSVRSGQGALGCVLRAKRAQGNDRVHIGSALTRKGMRGMIPMYWEAWGPPFSVICATGNGVYCFLRPPGR